MSTDHPSINPAREGRGGEGRGGEGAGRGGKSRKIIHPMSHPPDGSLGHSPTVGGSFGWVIGVGHSPTVGGSFGCVILLLWVRRYWGGGSHSHAVGGSLGGSPPALDR